MRAHRSGCASERASRGGRRHDGRQAVQAPGEAHARAHAFPPRAPAQEASSEPPVSENYLSVAGKEQVRLETSVEYSGAQLPQSRGDDAMLHCNLVLAFAFLLYDDGWQIENLFPTSHVL